MTKEVAILCEDGEEEGGEGRVREEVEGGREKGSAATGINKRLCTWADLRKSITSRAPPPLHRRPQLRARDTTRASEALVVAVAGA